MTMYYTSTPFTREEMAALSEKLGRWAATALTTREQQVLLTVIEAAGAAGDVHGHGIDQQRELQRLSFLQLFMGGVMQALNEQGTRIARNLG